MVLAVPVLFFTFFKLLQNPAIYNRTLGKISANYQRTGPEKQYSISKVTIPFIDITEQNAYNWDAAYYLAMRDKMYSGVNLQYADRYAYFPFFPLIWKLSFIRSWHIIFLNYLFFGIALILLSRMLMANKSYAMLFFALALLMPSAIIFYLPYAESLFILTFAVAITGIYKKQYWLYFLAMLCFTLTRPAVLILIFSLLGTDIIFLLKYRNIKHSIRQSILTLSPVITGWLMITILQYYYSGSWTTYFDANDLWPTESGFLSDIKDWSGEGFGMDVFAIFFLAIPALFYSVTAGVTSLLRKNNDARKTISLFEGNASYIKDYLFNLSVIFTAGILMYYLTLRSNALNDFNRYTMSVPFFYIILFLLPEKLEKIRVQYKLGAIVLAAVALILFMLNITYTGKLWKFEYSGLYLFLFITPLVVFEKNFSATVKLAWLFLLIIPAIIWQAYLFNMYLSNAWIFT